MDDGARRAILRLIGLGVRARSVVVGVELVRAAARKKKLALAIVATDVSPHSKAKVVPVLQATGVLVIDGPTAAELGEAVGKKSTGAVGVTDPGLAKGIHAAASAAVRVV